MEDFENHCTESGKIEHFELKQNIIDPLFGNSSLAFIEAGELFFNTGDECGAFYSLGSISSEFVKVLVHFVSNSIFFSPNDFPFDPE